MQQFERTAGARFRKRGAAQPLGAVTHPGYPLGETLAAAYPAWNLKLAQDGVLSTFEEA